MIVNNVDFGQSAGEKPLGVEAHGHAFQQLLRAVSVPEILFILHGAAVQPFVILRELSGISSSFLADERRCGVFLPFDAHVVAMINVDQTLIRS